MKKLIIAALVLGSAPAFAQNSLTTTQNPPAGASSASTPNPTNSLPQAAGTEKPTNQPGSTVGGAASLPSGAGATTTAPSTTPAK